MNCSIEADTIVLLKTTTMLYQTVVMKLHEHKSH